MACIGALTHYTLSTPHPIQLILQLPSNVIWYGVGLGFLVTVLPTVMLIQSIERLGASQSAMIASIGPVLTILLAVVFLNEHLNMWQWVGCLLNIVGVMMITLRKKRLRH